VATKQVTMRPTELTSLWVLVHKELGHVIPAVDCSGDLDFLAYPTYEAALAGAKHQTEVYDCECLPFRVK